MRAKSQRRPFRRAQEDAKVVRVGGEGNQMPFEFVDFVHTELDKLRSKLDNAPHARAHLSALQAVVAYHRGRGEDNRPVRQSEQNRRSLVRKVASRVDDGDPGRDGRELSIPEDEIEAETPWDDETE